ncbi:hypothetical protein MANES_16G020600v8 [Manihot esculenta]|uniref:Uncharacterized protein n=1 Tax=Manihot esculenta TaxID=3983 RepID=A0ACB7G645_MANES|nr:hypothetical protein MANES_16G020600v8 [Manihot esculenta]
MASSKREFAREDDAQPEQPESKRIRSDADGSDSPKIQPCRNSVVLNPADCNLDFDIGDDGLKGSALHEEGFAYCWSGARANFGITGGKYCFGCKVTSAQPVNMEDTPPDQQHLCRIGISRGDGAVGSLGETLHGFGLGGTGKFSTAGKFSDYGEKFGVGDTIVCAVDLESKPLASIGFAKNGKWLGIAKEFDAGPRGLGVLDSPIKELQWESALFPHVLLKNVVVQLHFSVEDGLVPEEGYKPWASALEDGNAIMGPVFPDIRDCEVMMMVGLPASGKTTWADKWVKEHPEKRYVLLGTNLILDQMKVPGLLRKHNYGERFDHLISRANAIFDILLSRAARTPHNYVIDQTNVFKSARKRKLRPFAKFHKIAVVVFPKPEELKFRADRRYKEMGKEVPADAVNNMLANYVLPMSKDMPGSDEFFDQVIFAELGRVEAQIYLEDMKHGLNTNSAPYYQETSVASSMGPSVQNQGVGGGNWGSSDPPHALGPRHLLNYGHQMANQVQTLYQGQGYCSGAYQSYQYHSVSRAPAPYSSNENFGPPHNGYLRSYGAIPADPYQSYGPVDRCSRPNLDVKSTAIYAAPTFDAYRNTSIEASQVGTMRSPSFTNAGGPQSVQAPIAPTYAPSACPPYGSHYGTSTRPMSTLSTSSPRPPYRNMPNVLQHPDGYNPRCTRYY